MGENSSPVEQRDGVSKEFQSGRLYERREVVQMINQLLAVEDYVQRSLLMMAWRNELAESAYPVRQVVVIEDTYILI